MSSPSEQLPYRLFRPSPAAVSIHEWDSTAAQCRTTILAIQEQTSAIRSEQKKMQKSATSLRSEIQALLAKVKEGDMLCVAVNAIGSRSQPNRNSEPHGEGRRSSMTDGPRNAMSARQSPIAVELYSLDNSPRSSRTASPSQPPNARLDSESPPPPRPRANRRNADNEDDAALVRLLQEQLRRREAQLRELMHSS